MDKFIQKALRFYFIIFCLPVFTLAQRADLVTKYADDLFENAQYQKAIKAYKEVLEQEPGHGKATFQLGEAYRLTFDYESAEYYYEQLANKDKRYPLSGYYYGSMLKYKGDYEGALDAFDSFDEFLKENDLHETKKYRYYHKQSRIEIDGCQLALNMETANHPSHQFELLENPLNSPYNDYAAFTIGADSVLCLTSARKGGKGSIADNEFGESLVDLFRFAKNSAGAWDTYDPKDRFDNINSKWGEGSGSFNRDRTKFYYTNCDGDVGDFCHIYVSYLEGGRWTEPESLNFNINEFGFDSQHPNLTPGGDTLFYVSDKEGGQGGLDLWMSINAGGDNWGPSINLGEAINTPFNESSPFYDSRDNSLWFASDGHRGFGGFDIYIAKGNSFESAEIYNAGFPFNSNRDDMFFFLGVERGYLTSNRDGGMGKFDIWGFNIKSNREIVDEVANEASIAGRNALFTEDYNFDNRNTDVINQIISRTLASNISDVDLVLTDEQLEVYNSLSLDDQERIEKIVNARTRKMTSNMMRSIRSEDDFYYQQLTTEKRQKVDRLVTDYLEQSGLGLSVILGSSESFYSTINAEEREKIDILLSERLKSAQTFEVASLTYNSYQGSDRKHIDGIAGKYLISKKNIKSLPLSVNEKVFMKNIGNGDIERLSAAVRERMLAMSKQNKYQLTDGDKKFYQNLTDAEKSAIKSLAASFMVSNLDNFEEIRNAGDVDLFRLKDSQTKAKIDKLIIQQIANLAEASVYLAETSFTKDELITAQDESYDVIYNNLLSLNKGFNSEEKNTLERFVKTSYKSFILTNEGLFMQAPTTVSVDRPTFINQQPAGDPSATLSTSEIETYNNLDVTKRKLIDRLVAFEYLSAAYNGNAELQSVDRESYNNFSFDEKTHVDILSKNLGDEALNGYEKSLRGYAFTYYNNLAPINKAQFNRIVLAKSFSLKNGKYVLSGSDASKRANLTEDERFLMLSLQKFRDNNERILTENLDVEAKDIDLPPSGQLALLNNSEASEPVHVDVSNVVEEVNEVRLDLPVLRNSSAKEINISGRLVDNVGMPLAQYPIKLKEHDKAETVIENYTDNEGFFSFDVKNDEYNISIDAANPDDVKLVNVDMKELKSWRPVSLQNSTRAYFDLGSASVRPETKVLLDEIIIAYNQSPMKIEIESHTDATGSEQVNIELSKKRGYATFNYLVGKGLNKSDISVIWHGQEKPIASNNNPAGRQLNRRIDIRVSENTAKMDFGHFFLVQPGATIYSVASNLKVSVDDFKKYNGLTSDELTAYQPIRVQRIDNINADPHLLVPADISVVNSNVTYTVQLGDNLQKISRKFNIPEELLMEINDISSPSDIAPGMKLSIYPETD